MVKRKFKITCFVDCTETICYELNTGIQRTVRNIIGRHARVSSVYDINVVPVVSIGGKFYPYDVDRDKKFFVSLLNTLFGRSRDAIDKIFFGKKVSLGSYSSQEESSVCLADAKGGVEKAFAAGVHFHFIDRCRTIMPFFFLVAFFLDRAFVKLKEADIKPHDVIFYPDAFWHAGTFQSMSRYNAIKILLVHDIIPVTNPEVCERVYCLTFRRNLSDVLNAVDGVISISGSELEKIRNYVADSHFKKVLSYDFNYWGADFAAKDATPKTIQPDLAAVMSQGPVFIVVGTLEPRKNHAFVIDAFEEIWRQGGRASLAIIGKPGWECSELLGRIRTHSQLAERLFYFPEVSDHELAVCYEKCAGVVFASLAEGFGLPLVEAMWYGRPVLASDLDVFREIGDTYPLYFSPDSVESLVSQLNACLDGAAARPAQQWISWDASVLNLFEKILNMAETVQSNRSTS